MKRRPIKLRWALPLLALALPHYSAAQEEGPIVFGAQQKKPLFDFTSVQAWADFLYRRQSSTQKPQGQPDQKFLENRFEETFSLDTTAYIYHPNLVDLHLAGTFGLRQDDLQSPGQHESENDVVNNYNVSATILRKEIAPLTLYSFRTQDIVNRTFGPSLDNTLSQTGAIWDIRSKNIPTRFEIYHSDQTEGGLGSDQNIGQGGVAGGLAASSGAFDLKQDTFLWHSEAHPTPNQTLTWDSTFSHVQEQTSGQPSEDFNTIDATLTHSIDFGQRLQNNLFSTLEYFNQDGDFALQRVHWNELLRMHLAPTIDTRLSYTLDSQDYLGNTQLTNRLVAGFTHRLYQSLVTSGDIGVQKLDMSQGGGNTEYFGDLRTDYTKKVPFGLLTAFAGLALDHQANEATSSPTSVVNSPVTFTDPFPVVIIGRNILPNSVVVTDTKGLFHYTPGIDYTLTSTPQRLEIDRTVNGRIADGQTVDVDYTLAPQGANTVDTHVFSFGGRYDIEQGFLKGLGVYGRVTRQNQDVTSNDVAAFIPNTFTDIVFGTDYRIGPLTLGAERETNDSTIYPFDADRFYAHYNRRLSLDTSYSINTSYNLIDYPDTGDRVNFLSLAGQIQHNFTRELSGYVSVLYQDEQHTLNGSNRGLEEQVELRWYHRQTSVYVMFRNSDFDTDTQNNNFQFLEVGIRRNF